MRISKYMSLHAGKNKQGKKYLKICVCNWRFVIANGRVALKTPRTLFGGKLRHSHKIKERKFEEHECKCEMCGKRLHDFKHTKLLHILPVSFDPEFARDPNNTIIFCTTCHKWIFKHYPQAAALLSLQ